MFLKSIILYLFITSSIFGARYLRFDGYASSDDGQINIMEIEAYSGGVNIATSATITTNFEVWEGSISDLNDGYVDYAEGGQRFSTSRYNPGQPSVASPHRIEFDFGSEIEIDEVRVYLEYYPPSVIWTVSYGLFLSQDGVTWTELETFTDVTGSQIKEVIAPIFTSSETTSSIMENSGADQVIYIAQATDASEVSYSLKSVEDFSSFSIDSTTGEVTILENPDYESKSSYAFTVVATNSFGNTSEKAVSLAIDNVIETSVEILTFTLNESGTSYEVSDCIDTPFYDLVIPSSYNNLPVTGIGSFAFSECSEIYFIKIPDGINYIRDSAFLNCINLDVIDIPKSVIAIGNSAFEGCTRLSTIFFQNENPPLIGSNIFNGVTADIFVPYKSTGYGDTLGGLIVRRLASEENVPNSLINLIEVWNGAYLYLTEDTLLSDGVEAPYAWDNVESVSDYSQDSESHDIWDFHFIDYENSHVLPYVAKVHTDAELSSDYIISYGAFYDGRADLDGNGKIDLLQIRDGDPFPGYGSGITLDTPDFVSVDNLLSNVDVVNTPVFTSSETATAIAENSGADQVIYTAVATDDYEAVRYSLKEGEDSSSFTIDGTSGEVTLKEDPDHETKSFYSLTVVATVGLGTTSEKVVTLAINDVEEADSLEEDPSWVPEGWVYYAWPYAYSFSEGRWHFFNELDTQWRVNLSSGAWSTLDAASGWNYYAWPYSYSFDEGAWHWYNNDTQWVVDLLSGEWSTFGSSGN